MKNGFLSPKCTPGQKVKNECASTAFCNCVKQRVESLVLVQRSRKMGIEHFEILFWFYLITLNLAHTVCMKRCFV